MKKRLMILGKYGDAAWTKIGFEELLIIQNQVMEQLNNETLLSLCMDTIVKFKTKDDNTVCVVALEVNVP